MSLQMLTVYVRRFKMLQIVSAFLKFHAFHKTKRIFLVILPKKTVVFAFFHKTPRKVGFNREFLDYPMTS